MDINLIIAGLQAHPQIQMILNTINPYMPLIIREGQEFYDDFISYAVSGKWTELDSLAWEKMTEEERDKLSEQILLEARESVDNQFRRNEYAKEIAFKYITSILKTIL